MPIISSSIEKQGENRWKTTAGEEIEIIGLAVWRGAPVAP
jgi:hypothetical protein